MWVRLYAKKYKTIPENHGEWSSLCKQGYLRGRNFQILKNGQNLCFPKVEVAARTTSFLSCSEVSLLKSTTKYSKKIVLSTAVVLYIFK